MFGYNSRYISRYSAKKTNKQQSKSSDKNTPRTPPVTPPPGTGKAGSITLSKSADEVLLKSKRPYYKSILKKPSVDNIDEKREDDNNNDSMSALLTAIPEPSSSRRTSGGGAEEEKEEAEGSSVEATLKEDGSVEASFDIDPIKSEESENSDRSNNFAAAIPWMEQQQPPQIRPSFSGEQQIQEENPQDGSIPSASLQQLELLKRRQYSRDSADDASSISSKSTVSFGRVRVREYERVIDTRMYMGLALGWAYNEAAPQPIVTDGDAVDDDAVDDVSVASQKSNQSSTKGGGGGDSVASEDGSHGGGESKSKKKKPPERFGTLLNYGYSRKQLKQATADATKYMKQVEKEEKAREQLEAKQARLHATAGGSSTLTAPSKPKKKTLLSRSSWM